MWVEARMSAGGVLVHGQMPASFFNELIKTKTAEFYILEGRPSLSSVKASAKQLQKLGIVPTVLADNMAGYLFYQNLLKEVWLACRPGKKSVVCDPGAIILQTLAKRHQIPVYGYRSQEFKKDAAAQADLSRFNGQKVVASCFKSYVPVKDELPQDAFQGIYG